jgi:pimeloyl-ACP methyl ester carboxylesterase
MVKVSRGFRSVLLVLLTLVGAIPPANAETGVPLTYVIVHGAWGGGWAFQKVDRLLSAEGHIVYRPTLTGQGEKVHLANPEIDLTTHITDVVNVILWENLRDVVLVGHSYGGMVITGVADRVPERLKRVIYLDALLPVDGENVADAFGGKHDLASKAVDGFIPAYAGAEAKPPPHDVPHPVRTVTQKISLGNQEAVAKIPATYVLFVPRGEERGQARFSRFYDRAAARGWAMMTLESDHNAQWSHPEELAKLLAAAVKSP